VGLPRVWGANADEVAAGYPCDRFSPTAAERWFRAVTVHAPRRVVFRSLCQLKVAPYSYDLLDNYSRRSPRKLTPGADRLAVGQFVMSSFALIDFIEDQHLTLRLRSGRGLRLFGEFTITYAVAEIVPNETRLVVKLLVGDGADTGALSAARRSGVAWRPVHDAPTTQDPPTPGRKRADPGVIWLGGYQPSAVTNVR
jgi:hypothetical protein